MKIIIELTDVIVPIGVLRTQRWIGESDRGVKVTACLAAVEAQIGAPLPAPFAKIVVSPTDAIDWTRGVPTRIWTGMSAAGDAVKASIALVTVRDRADLEDFERQLGDRSDLILSPAAFRAVTEAL